MPHWRSLFTGRVPFGIAAAALATLATQSPARGQGSPVDDATKPGWRDALRRETGDLCDSIKSFTHVHFGDTAPMSRVQGVHVLKPGAWGIAPADWAALDVGTALPERVVLLVHGLDDTGDVWNDLAPAIRRRPELASLGVARLDYPNDQSLAASAGLLDEALANLAGAGARSVDLVCHSMGGLIARDVLTRADFYDGRPTGHSGDARPRPDLRRLILLGTPNLGSPFARLQCLSEARETLWRWIDSDNHNVRDLARFDLDGDGQAGRDLLPGSDYLTELNARPTPDGSKIAITSIVARVTTADDLRLEEALSKPVVKKILGDEKAESLLESCRELTRGLGDGVVSARSAQLPGAGETIFIESTHRGMVREVNVFGLDNPIPEASVATKDGAVPGGANTKEPTDSKPFVVPPAIPFILDRIGN